MPTIALGKGLGMTIPSLNDLQHEFDRGVEQFRAYMRTEEGEKVRKRVAGVLITAAPVIAYVAGRRRPVIGRLLGSAGAATILVKIGEKIRDWEPPAVSQ